MPSSAKEPSSATTSSAAAAAAEAEDVFEQYQESKAVDTSKRVVEKETSSFSFSTEDEKQPSSFSSNFNFNGREESGIPAATVGMEKERFDSKNALRGSSSQKTSSVGYTQSSTDIEEKVQKVSPPRQKAYRDDRLEKQQGFGLRRDYDNMDIMSPTSYRQQNTNNSNANTSNVAKQNEPEHPPDGSINEILEVGFILSSQQLMWLLPQTSQVHLQSHS